MKYTRVMASLIPGYEYDIFISYRQKDNKYDGWVTVFVDNLKSELEATFKEEISVYFDVGTHDGLLETHDVDASLKNKLKCLVFIPIVSRTYCDPKSFAWEHEFRAFVDFASADSFGLMITLPGGNVASRVLPVRIHDLEPADISQCEKILGGHMRGIDFIYREPGVNKPLTGEDDEKKNLNRTKYRLQINRTANAINEIISGMLTFQVMQPDKVKPEEKPEVHAPVKKKSGKWLFPASSSVLVVLAVAAFFLFSSGSNLPFSKRDWILITDFENQTRDPVYDKSLYTAFTISASQSRYLNVFPRSGMTESLKRMNLGPQSIIDEKTGREVAIREGIDLYISPGISEAGNKYAITVKIIEAESDSLLKSIVIYADSQDKILSSIDQLSRKIRHILGESRYNISLQDKPLAKVTTSSLEALKVYSIGIQQTIGLDFTGARDSYDAALKIDSGFVAAKASLGNLLYEKFDMVRGSKLLDEAVKDVDKLTERERLGILAFHAAYVLKSFPKAIVYARARIDLYPDDPAAHNNAGWYYQNSGQLEKAAEEYKEVIRIDPKMALSHAGLVWVYFELGKLDSVIHWSKKMIVNHPANPWGYAYLGSAYCALDSLERARSFFIKANELDPNMAYSLYRHAHTCRLMGKYEEAIKLLNGVLEVDHSDISAYCDIGVNYSRMGLKNEADKYFNTFKKAATEQWLKLFPDNYATYTWLAAAEAHLGNMEESGKLLLKATELDSAKHFQFAAVLCAQGKIPETLRELELALEGGYRDITWIKMQPDLEPLRYDVRFHNLLSKYFK